MIALLARISALSLASAAALALAQAPAAAQVQRDWTATVVETPEGGFRMGNPDAPVRVVEFVSLTCPHCRNFGRDGAPRLVADYVRSGRVSFEIRPFPLDPVASLAAQLTRCTTPAHGFALSDQILATQDEWTARITGLSDQEIAALQALSEGELRLRVAALTGLDALAAQHGVSARECLADQAQADRIDAIKAAGEAQGVGGTPSFMLNGRLLDGVHDWAGLEPLLRAAR